MLFVFRVAVVTFLWLICLPVGTSKMCRFFFVRSLNSMFVVRQRMELGTLVADWMQGVLLSLLVVAVFLAVSALREYMLRNERVDLMQNLHAQPNQNQEDAAMQQDNPHLDFGGDAGENERNEAGGERNGAQQDFGNADPGGWQRDGLGLLGDIEPEADDVMLGFFDGREEEVPLDEFVGLRGPLRVMLENALTALISNGLFIGILTLIPFSLGRVVLWLKHNWQLLLTLPFWLYEDQPEHTAYYSDAVTLLVGYCCVMFLVLTGAVASLLIGGGGQWLAPQSPLMLQMLSLIRYGVILCKVGMLLAVELVAFPIGCGWWLDMCSLHLVDAHADQRFSFLKLNFLASHFLHWLVGVVFMLHISVFVAVLREVVRPEILWFLRNPADAEEHPLRDLIDEPLSRHARRIILSSLLYIPLTFGFVYVPISIAKLLWPALFPLSGAWHDPFSEVPAPLLLLQVSLPLVMEHFRPRDSFKTLLHWWLDGVGQYVGLRHRILPSPVTQLVPSHQAEDANEPASESEGAGAECKEQEERLSLWLRATLVIALGWATLAFLGAVCIVLPVGAGRGVLAMAGAHVPHDVYAFSLGFFLVGVGVECLGKLAGILQSQGAASLMSAVLDFSTQIGKCLVAGAVLLVLVPATTGVLLDLVLAVPLRVGLYQTPVLGTLWHWVLGVLVLKLSYRAILHSPGWAPAHRQLLLQAAQQRWRSIRLRWLMVELGLPLLATNTLLLSLPYSFAFGVLPLLGVPPVVCSVVWRWAFPAGAGAAALWMLWLGLGQVFKQLHDSLRDSLYLVGRRLHNLS